MASSYVISPYVISTTYDSLSYAWTTALHRPHRDISLTLMTSPLTSQSLTCISPSAPQCMKSALSCSGKNMPLPSMPLRVGSSHSSG